MCVCFGQGCLKYNLYFDLVFFFLLIIFYEMQKKELLSFFFLIVKKFRFRNISIRLGNDDIYMMDRFYFFSKEG